MVLILLVEDDVDIREDIQEVLMLEGYDVKVADDGIAGLEILQQHAVDMILSDVAMPEMNGYEFLARVRKLESYQEIPFIFVSAVAPSAIEEHVKGLNVSAILAKPFAITTLIEIVDEMSQQSK